MQDQEKQLKSSERSWRNHGGIAMTMFDVDTVNVEKSFKEIEDNDLYNFMKNRDTQKNR